MLRKFLGMLVLASMVLHCCSRLGVLDLLYKHRYNIMLAVGVIQEKPIATCDQHYFVRQHIGTIPDNHGPNRYMAVTHEMNLFSPVARLIPQDRTPDGQSLRPAQPVTFRYTSPHLDIFHPPMA